MTATILGRLGLNSGLAIGNEKKAYDIAYQINKYHDYAYLHTILKTKVTPKRRKIHLTKKSYV